MRNPFIAMAMAVVAMQQAFKTQAIAAFNSGNFSGSGPRRPGNKPGKYVPHQGKRECARRVRQFGLSG